MLERSAKKKRYHSHSNKFHPVRSSVPLQKAFEDGSHENSQICTQKTNRRCWDDYCLALEAQNRLKPVEAENSGSP